VYGYVCEDREDSAVLEADVKKVIFSAQAKDALHTEAIGCELRDVLAIDADCPLCIVHHERAGSYGEGGDRCLGH